MVQPVLIVIPTCPRWRGNEPAGYLETALTSATQALEHAGEPDARIVIQDCTPTNQTHSELEKLPDLHHLRTPIQIVNRRGLTVSQIEIPELVSLARLRRDGPTASRWTYQQSLDFLEAMDIFEESGAEWMLRAEDDVEFSERFLSRSFRGASRHPDASFYSLFSIRLRFDGQTTHHHTGAPALLIPRRSLTTITQHVKKMLHELPFDVALGDLGGLTLYPSLVQHKGRVRSESSLGHDAGFWSSPTFRRGSGLAVRGPAQIAIAGQMALEAWKRWGAPLFSRNL